MKPFKSKPIAPPMLPKPGDKAPKAKPKPKPKPKSDKPTPVGQSPGNSDPIEITQPVGPGLHYCTAATQPGGYGHLLTTCLEDYKGHLWVINETGRRMSMVNWCPFCGFQALNAAEVLTTLNPSFNEADQSLPTTTPDKPQRVWKQFGDPVLYDHFLFGKVKVYASDGCHAKIKSDLHRGYLTVCMENLTLCAGVEIPTLSKVLRPKTEKKPKATESLYERYKDFLQ